MIESVGLVTLNATSLGKRVPYGVGATGLGAGHTVPGSALAAQESRGVRPETRTFELGPQEGMTLTGDVGLLGFLITSDTDGRSRVT